MKVKIFSGSSSGMIEDQVNEFFRDLGDSIDVQSITQSECATNDDNGVPLFKFTLTVFYLVAH